jgi:hypothetical protein
MTTLTLTKAPHIALQNIKRVAHFSEETHCYTAVLYVDGERWGTVSNRGHGGPDDFHGEGGRGYGDIETLNTLIAQTFKPYVFGDEGRNQITLEQNLEMVCGDLVNQWLRDKDFARAMKAKVLFTKPDVAGIWELAVKKPHTHASMLDAMKAKYPQYTYLADLPVDEAKAIYFAD